MKSVTCVYHSGQTEKFIIKLYSSSVIAIFRYYYCYIIITKQLTLSDGRRTTDAHTQVISYAVECYAQCKQTPEN